MKVLGKRHEEVIGETKRVDFWLMLRLALLVAVALPLAAQPDLGYRHVENWGRLPAGHVSGQGMAVAADAGGAIWFYNRGSHPVIQLAPDGLRFCSTSLSVSSALAGPGSVFLLSLPGSAFLRSRAVA